MNTIANKAGAIVRPGSRYLPHAPQLLLLSFHKRPSLLSPNESLPKLLQSTNLVRSKSHLSSVALASSRHLVHMYACQTLCSQHVIVLVSAPHLHEIVPNH